MERLQQNAPLPPTQASQASGAPMPQPLQYMPQQPHLGMMAAGQPVPGGMQSMSAGMMQTAPGHMMGQQAHVGLCGGQGLVALPSGSAGLAAGMPQQMMGVYNPAMIPQQAIPATPTGPGADDVSTAGGNPKKRRRTPKKKIDEGSIIYAAQWNQVVALQLTLDVIVPCASCPWSQVEIPAVLMALN